ncbi:helix-turn-helix domain-containing protein [Lysobacter terrae]
MDKVIGLLRREEGRALSIADLLQVSGVSERTLRSYFQECFGIGPHRYLHIRRMYLIRTALILSELHHETVSNVAKRFGYSDAGRMAAEYLDMFGEYPHQTLERHLSE